MIITFNYKDGTATITLDDVKRAIKKNNTGSDLDCLGAPAIDLHFVMKCRSISIIVVSVFSPS